jgi:hypothetical protein
MSLALLANPFAALWRLAERLRARLFGRQEDSAIEAEEEAEEELAGLHASLHKAQKRLASLEQGLRTFLSTPAAATLVVQGSLQVLAADGRRLVVGEQANGSFGISAPPRE